MRVRQIYFREDQKSSIISGAIPFYNESANEYLETQVISDLHKMNDHVGSEYYGVWSWKFASKVACNSIEFVKVLMAEEEADVYSFMSRMKMGINTGKHVSVWAYADRWHDGFCDTGQALMNSMGIDVDLRTLETPIIYYNYWLMKEEIFDDYVNNFLNLAVESMKNDIDLQMLLFRDAKYKNSEGTQLDEKGCMKVFGRPYYTYHPFIAERLLSTYVALNKVKFKHLI